PQLVAKARIKISSTLLAAGIFSEAKDSLRAMHTNGLDKNIQSEYFFYFSRLYMDMSDYYLRPIYDQTFKSLSLNYLDSAITTVDKNSPKYYSYKGLRSIRAGEFEEAIDNYDLLFDNYEVKGRQYAVDASTYSYALERVQRMDESVEWLIRAAIM